VNIMAQIRTLANILEAWVATQVDNNNQLSNIVTILKRIETKMSLLDDKLNAVIANVTDENTVIDGAITFINSVPGLIQTAVTAALAAGATPAQLQAVTDLGTAITNKSSALKTALVAGTPPAPPATVA
jgi:hypothetical protein